MSERRTRSIKIRLTEQEHQALKVRQVGGRLATWMRAACLGHAKRSAARPGAVPPALLRQLSGLGNNLNQVARRVNAERHPAAAEIIAALVSIERELNHIRQQHDRDI